MSRRIVIGTRGSALALAQANGIADRLRAAAPEADVGIEVFKTQGDRDRNTMLSQLGGKGVFTKELEEALLAGTADVAVHSLKDLPTELPEGLCLGAVPGREDPRDAFVSTRYSNVDALPEGARVGTSSLRRGAQLKAYRPDLQLVNIRGNVETRLAKIDAGEADATVLACAGLRRLGLAHHITQALGPDIMVSAVGQGALGLEIREDDDAVRELIASLIDPAADAETRAERALLAALEGGCQVPIGARAMASGPTLTLRACVASLDGTAVLRAEEQGPVAEPEALGRLVAQHLADAGATALIAAIR